MPSPKFKDHFNAWEPVLPASKYLHLPRCNCCYHRHKHRWSYSVLSLRYSCAAREEALQKSESYERLESPEEEVVGLARRHTEKMHWRLEWEGSSQNTTTYAWHKVESFFKACQTEKQFCIAMSHSTWTVKLNVHLQPNCKGLQSHTLYPNCTRLAQYQVPSMTLTVKFCQEVTVYL